ncbi:MAG: MMPL family transporter [Fluviicoccus sp.]|uniref:efflux RND transporter permease subunit n=1 Tax=Fluviicoccus sp. TaxID=2003552 RepID=UPI0027251BF6|nr:MMPL family transporter [Fluviicoccus sp.]MDO8329059.1 MMPL family transporter [Fluviicoccus sp.]
MTNPAPAPSRIDRMWSALADWIVSHPWTSIIVSLLVTLAVSAGSAGYIYSTDHRAFFGKDNPQLLAYEKLQEDYTKTDTVLIAVAPKDGKVFTPEFLGMLQDLTKAGWQVPYSQRVESLTNFQHVKVDGDNIATEDLVVDPTMLDAAALESIKQTAVSEPFLVDSLVNPQGSVAGVRITLNMPGKEPLKEIPAVVDHIRTMTADMVKAHPGVEVHLAGQPIANKAYPEESQADGVRVWPWFLLTMMVMLSVLFRSLKAMFVTLVACILAVLGGAGFIGLFKFVVNDGVIVAPVMILSMAFADGIHVVVNWIQAVNQGKSKRDAMAESLSVNMGPMTVTSVMTAIGFLTLLFNDSPPFQVMGLIVAAGVVFALLLTFFFTAPLLVLLPGEPPRKISPLMREDSPTVARFADFIIARHKPILVACFAVAAVFIAFIPQNRINDDIVKYYTPEAKFRQDVEFVNANLTGIAEVNYSLPAGSADNIVDPAYLRQLDAFGNWLKAQPDVTQVNSLVDIIKRINQVMHGNDPAFYRIPDTREEIAQYLLQYELSMPYGMDLNYLIRFDRSESRVRVAVGTSSGQRIIALDAAAQGWLKANAPKAMQVQGSSLNLMFAHISERSINGMFGGMLGSLVAESLFVMLVFRAFRLGLASFLGNLIPIGMAFGSWAMLNGNIDVGLTVVLGIAFSVVVDDTIHFISKYERARKVEGKSPEDAVRYAFSHVGFALLSTTAVLGSGYAWLANSAIQLTVNTAIVTVTTIGIALVIDVFLLPSLFLVLDKRTVKTG